MEKTARQTARKSRKSFSLKEMPFWANQCAYGVSILLTFTVVGQIVQHI